MSATTLEAFRREMAEAHRRACMASNLESMLAANAIANRLARIVARAKQSGAAS